MKDQLGIHWWMNHLEYFLLFHHSSIRIPIIVELLKLIKLGQSLEIAELPVGMDNKTFDVGQQKIMLQKSLDYLRRNCGAGLKS